MLEHVVSAAGRTEGLGALGGHATQEARLIDRVAMLERRLLELGVLDHHVKSDATIVNGWACLLRDQWDGLTDEQRRHAVDVIARRSQRLADTAREVLREAWAGWVSAASERDVVDLAAEVSSLAGEVDQATATHTIRYDGPATLPARTDAEAVDRIVVQLVENAVQYSPSGSVVTVRLAGDDDRVRMEVVDQGVGVPAGEDLFEPFVRSDADASGGGIGLFIVRSTVESLGGSVEAKRNDDRGSTFTVVLPR